MCCLLVSLRDLDVSNNELTTFPPPAEWKTKSLEYFLLGENRIRKVRSINIISSYQFEDKH